MSYLTDVKRRMKVVLDAESRRSAVEFQARETAIAEQAALEVHNTEAVKRSELTDDDVRKLAIDARRIENVMAQVTPEMGCEGTGADRARWLAKANLTIPAIDRATSTDSISKFWSLPGFFDEWREAGLSQAPNEQHYIAVAAVARLADAASSAEDRDDDRNKREARTAVLAKLADEALAASDKAYAEKLATQNRLEK